MAAIYSGIHLKLKSPQTPWEDKLKLAQFAWISTQCLLVNKEQVLLDWCTHALTGWYSHKVEFPEKVLQGLWCYLDDLLHSHKLHTLLKEGKTISLRLNMAQLLIDRVQECTSVDSKMPVCFSTILSVFQGIFTAPALSSVFTTKFELLVDLVAKFCFLACRELLPPSPTDPQNTESVPEDPKPACDFEGSQNDSENHSESPSLDANRLPSDLKENLYSSRLFEALLQILSCYASVQRQQANPNRVFTMVTNQLLQPLVLLRQLLTSGELSLPHTRLRLRHQLCKDIRVKIDSILRPALFPSEHLTSYRDELLSSKEDSGKRGTKGVLKPVSAVLSKLSAPGYCEPTLLHAVKVSTLPLLFKFFLESYSKGRGDSEEAQRMLCFSFLTKLIPVLDISLDTASLSPAKEHDPTSVFPGTEAVPASRCSPVSWSLAMLALESLLAQALTADIYNVAADRIRHEEVQLNFYRVLAQMLFNQAQPSIPAWYRCLKVLLSLNHLILEPDLDQLLSSAWVNSENMDARVQRARQLLVCGLLQTYTKLRQLPRLFSELLSVVCQPALDILRPSLLSEGISSSLTTCLLDTPPSQSLEICMLVLESIRKYILPDMMEVHREPEKMEIDEEGGDNKLKLEQEKEDASLKLFSLSQLLHVVMFSLKTLDNSSPILLVKKSQGLVEEMQQVVKELNRCLGDKIGEKRNMASAQKMRKKRKKSGTEKISAWEQKTQEAALLLRYTFTEVDTLFSIHCSKYTPLNLANAEKSGTTVDASPAQNSIESLFSECNEQSCSPMSTLLVRLLTLQHLKKVLLDSPLLSEPGTSAQLKRAAEFISATSEFNNEESVWDGQIGNVNTGSYDAAHWYLVTSNLPLMAPYLSRDDMSGIADLLVSSLIRRDTDGGKDSLPGQLSVSIISSQLLKSSVLTELPSLFSATVGSLTQRVICVLKAAHVPNTCSTFLKCQEKETEASSTLSSLLKTECLVEDILASSKSGQVFLCVTPAQSKELLNILNILSDLHPDGMSSQDLSSVFLLLFFLLTSASCQSEQAGSDAPGPLNDAVLLVKLLQSLTCLLEGRNFQSVLKLIHGGTLLQAAVSSLLWKSNTGRFGATSNKDWFEVIKAVQSFIRCFVLLIITRNSSVRLNLDQFTTYLTEAASKQTAGQSKAHPEESILSVHLLLASLTSLSQAMTSNLSRSKPMDQTLTQMLTRTTSALGPAVESVLKHQTVGQTSIQPAGVLGQAFVVEVVTVMLQCELSAPSSNEETKLNLNHLSLYQSFCQQILKEISSASRPMDFLISSLHFLSAFYKAVKKTAEEKAKEEGEEKGKEEGEEKDGRKEEDELFMQMVQTMQRLLTVSWLSSDDVCELEPAVQELLRPLLEKSSTAQLNLLLLLIRDGLDCSKLRAGRYREVLSAVIITKLLSYCQLPEPCSKALWLIAPQILSAMVSLVRSARQYVSLTLPFTVPTVTAMTSLLRRGEGRINNPHHVILVLGALQSVPLGHLTPPVYQSVFLAVHEALFAIIQCHPQVMLNAAPSFLNVFHRLVSSIMQEGRQRGDGDTGPDNDVYLQCSRLIERMYSHIAATAESFTTLSTFMVAQYVTELQKVTLRPDIKQHLTEGIYRILDLSLEQDIKFLMASLQSGVREVFNELYGSYTHYHKAQRQGEDKYTV